MPEPSLITAPFGPYVLCELISAGGIAEVYRGQHGDDGAKSVAVKVMRPEKQIEKHHHKAFLAEYQLLTQLKHPGLPVGRREGEIKGRAAFAMDLIPGEAMHLAAKAGREWNRAAGFVDLVGIVAYVHSQGVVHADLKLENAILRPNGKVGLVDFGNARRLNEGGGLLAKLFGGKNKPIFGTPTYLAPELLNGGEATCASDMYALGICAFIILSGEPPFTATRASGRLRANVKDTAPSIRSRCDLPIVAAKTIDSCLAKDPKARPEDASQLLHGIREMVALIKSGTETFRRQA